MKIGLIGNCQTHNYHSLIRVMLPHSEVVLLDLVDPGSRTQEYIQKMIECLKDCDFILCQPNQWIQPNREFFCAGQVVMVGNFFFRGLQPDMCLLAKFDERIGIDLLGLRQSLVILDAYLRGLPVDGAAASFTEENYHRLGLFEAWESSLAVMRERDKSVDFPLAKLIDESARLYPAFLTGPHPAFRLMYDYFSLILREVGIAHEAVDFWRIPDPMEEKDRAHVFNLIGEYHNLPYRMHESWRISAVGPDYLDKSRLAEEFYKVYDKVPSERLKVYAPDDMADFLRASPDLRFLVNDLPGV